MNNKFGISEEQMRALVAEGLRNGGSWCDLYFEDTVYLDLLLRDSEVNSGGYHQDYGCGIRVLDGEKTGYAYSESTDYASLLNAARAAASIAGSNSSSAARPRMSTGFRALCKSEANQKFYPQQSDWKQSEAARFAPLLKKIDSEIHRRESRADKVVAMLSWSVSDIMMFNSLGELTYDTRPLANLSVSVVFTKDGKNENNYTSRSFRMGSEMLTEALLEDLAESMKQMITGNSDGLMQRGQLPLTARTKKIIDMAGIEAGPGKVVDTVHLVLAMLREGENAAAQLLFNAGVTVEKFVAAGAAKGSGDSSEQSNVFEFTSNYNRTAYFRQNSFDYFDAAKNKWVIRIGTFFCTKLVHYSFNG